MSSHRRAAITLSPESDDSQHIHTEIHTGFELLFIGAGSADESQEVSCIHIILFQELLFANVVNPDQGSVQNNQRLATHTRRGGIGW